MKNLILAIIMLMSMTAKTQIVGEIKDLSNGTILFTVNDFQQVITPNGITETTIKITSNIDIDIQVKNMVNEKIEGTIVYPGLETPYNTLKISKSKTETFKVDGINLSPNTSYRAIVAYKLTIPGSGSILSGGLGGGDITTPAIRPLIAKNSLMANPGSVEVASEITTSNVDEVVSYDIKDASGNVLMAVKETINATIEPVKVTKSITINLNQYPTATSLTTTSQTGGSQKLNLKSASSGISPLNTVQGMTDETTIQIFNTLGQSLGFTTWGQEKNMSRDVFYKTETMTKPERKPIIVF